MDIKTHWPNVVLVLLSFFQGLVAHGCTSDLDKEYTYLFEDSHEDW